MDKPQTTRTLRDPSPVAAADCRLGGRVRSDSPVALPGLAWLIHDLGDRSDGATRRHAPHAARDRTSTPAAAMGRPIADGGGARAECLDSAIASDVDQRGSNRSTIRDVASAAGVSIATVSRVLNERPDVASGTREKVLRVARELRFTTNRSARSLSGGRTFMIGVARSDASPSRIAGSAASRARRHVSRRDEWSHKRRARDTRSRRAERSISS